MTKLNKFSLISLLAFSAASMAETYTVSVEMNSSIGETPLVATQTQPMTYPVLEVNEITQEGSLCRVDDKANSTGHDGQPATSRNSLCPGATGKRSQVRFSGLPDAVVTIQRRLPLQVQNGVRFGWEGSEFSDVLTKTLSSTDGSYVIGLSSSITLFDKSLVTDSVMVFNYEISAAYQ